MHREDRPMRAIEIARLVVVDKGLDVEDRDLVNRVKVAIDASLRAKEGQYVNHSGGHGREWFIIEKERPNPSSQSDNP